MITEKMLEYLMLVNILKHGIFIKDDTIQDSIFIECDTIQKMEKRKCELEKEFIKEFKL